MRSRKLENKLQRLWRRTEEGGRGRGCKTKNKTDNAQENMGKKRWREEVKRREEEKMWREEE